MLEMLKRNFYRITRNFTALVIYIMTLEFVVGPFYYLSYIKEVGWYALDWWQIKMIFTAPISDIEHYATTSILLLLLWEVIRAFWVVGRFAFRKGVTFLG